VRFVVLDVETTGVVPVEDRITWLACAVVVDGSVTRRWSTLLTTDRPRPSTAGAGLAFPDIAEELVGLLDSGVLVAHNAGFDLAFLRMELQRCNRSMPRIRSLCTMKLARYLDLPVASWSLVDCCAAFGISHRRRHRADEDVEATVQLLGKLLPVAAAQGWSSMDELIDVLEPTTAAGRDGGSLTFTIDLGDVIGGFYEKVGWDPDGEENLGDAIRRTAPARRAERVARYAEMTVDHRAAHEAWDACADNDDSETTWAPILAALEREDCGDLAEAWSAWSETCASTAEGRRRRLTAVMGLLNAVLKEPEVTRGRFEWHVHQLSAAAEATTAGVEVAVGWYVDNVDRLVALPPCGECHETGYRADRGCRRGLPCTRAALGFSLVTLLDLRVDTSRTFDRLATSLAAALRREPDPTALGRLALLRLRRHLAAGQADEGWKLWCEAQAYAAAIGMLPLISSELASAMEDLLRGKHYERIIEALGPLTDAEPTFNRQSRSRIRDALSESFERTGRVDEAAVVWHRAIEDRATEKYVTPFAPSKVQWKYDRLSLMLERRRHYQAALDTCTMAISRFRHPLDSLLRRAERCRTRIERGE
jgi:Exonuclease